MCDDADDWERAKQLVAQWRRGDEEEAVAACGNDIRLLTKLLVLLDQEERPEVIASWYLHRHR